MMKKNVLAVALLMLGLVAMSSCSTDNVEDLTPEVDPCDTVTVTFSGTISTIIELNCSNPNFNPGGSCHEAGSPIADYTTYAGFKAKVDNGQLRERVLNQRTMPPPFSEGPRALSACDMKLIERWLDAGAPNN